MFPRFCVFLWRELRVGSNNNCWDSFWIILWSCWEQFRRKLNDIKKCDNKIFNCSAEQNLYSQLRLERCTIVIVKCESLQLQSSNCKWIIVLTKWNTVQWTVEYRLFCSSKCALLFFRRAQSDWDRSDCFCKISARRDTNRCICYNFLNECSF